MAAKNTSKKHNRKKARSYIFYPVYWCMVLLCLGAIALMMRVLWDNMADYEASMPKYVAQEVEKIFTERDFETMYEYDSEAYLAGSEGKQAYVEYMNRLTAGYEISCKEHFSVNPDEKIYQVKFGANKLATYTLHKSGEKSKFGNVLWELKGIETSVITTQEYRITAPESSSVYADGQLLDDSHVVERGLELTEGYLPEGYEHDKWQTYSVKRCFSVPRFEVKDTKGRTQAFMPDEEGRLTAVINYDDEILRPEVEETVVKVAKAFAMFTSDDYHTENLLRLVMPDSKAAEYIMGFDGDWFTAHREVHFLNMRTEKYVQYSENMFSCEVYFDYKIDYDRERSETYPTGYKFFFEKQNDTWLLFDFTTAG